MYYRVAYHGLDVKDGDDFHKLRMYYKNFSIIILDSKYNKIGETKFPPDKYYIGNIFIAPEGIYISENNPDNPNFDENFIQFRLFKINEN